MNGAYGRKKELTLTAEPIHQVVAAIESSRAVAIVRSATAEQAVTAGRQLLSAGVRVLEVSLNTPGAIGAIAALLPIAGERGAIIGVGTATDAHAVGRAAAVGARFFVSPALDLPAIAAAHQRGMAAIPGCATPTEMITAHRAGADAIKVFPATGWNPAGLTNVVRALPYLRLIPTGGVEIDDAPAWIRAGATAIGVGSSLFRTADAVQRLHAALAPFTSGTGT